MYSRAFARFTVLCAVAAAAVSCRRTEQAAAPAEAPRAETSAPAQAPASAPTQAAQPGLPPGHPPIESGPARPILAPGGKGQNALAWDVPKGWVFEPPANDTRRAQYRVPGKGGDAECVVFYFGAGQGGDAAANLDRWGSQFEGAGKPRTRELTVDGMKASLIKTSGTYMAGAMSSAPIDRKSDWALVGAVVEGPDSNWFFKLTGPKATVDAESGAFERLVRSIRKGGPKAG